MKKGKLILAASLAFSLFSSVPVFAEESDNETSIKACEPALSPVPAEGEAILLEDNSTSTRGLVSRINVNQVYSIRIQDIGGSCVSSAKINVTGTYLLDGGNASISNVNLKATVASAPANWTVQITGQSASVNRTSLNYRISYRSIVNDPFGCLVGGGYWYSGITVAIR